MKYFFDILKIFEFKKTHLISLLFTIAIYFIVASNNGIPALKVKLNGAKIAIDYVEPGLFLALLISCFLTVSGLRWVLLFTLRLIKSIFASLIKRYQVWQTAHAANKLTNRRYMDVIAVLSTEEKSFLELFRADSIALQRMASESLLPHKTYVANNYLIMKRLIKTDHIYKKRYAPSVIIETENFALEKEAIPSLRRLFYGGKSPLTKIVLRMDRIAASGMSGSGAHQCNFRRR